jgi:hypothetical protein
MAKLTPKEKYLLKIRKRGNAIKRAQRHVAKGHMVVPRG